MRHSVWQTLSPEAVVRLSCELYREIGGGNLHDCPRAEAWRDESLLNLSAIYTVAHGFVLGAAGDGLAFQVLENWEKRSSGTAMVGVTVRARSLGEPYLNLDYRHGQLQCELPAGSVDAAHFGRLVEAARAGQGS
ncbi:MAG: hypothetical protein ACOY5B_04490 [Spirochaetota bacterium]